MINMFLCNFSDSYFTSVKQMFFGPKVETVTFGSNAPAGPASAFLKAVNAQRDPLTPILPR